MSDWDSVWDTVDERRKTALRATQQLTVAPDTAARASTIADKRGLPYGVVADNLEDFERQDREDGIAAIGERNQVVGDFLSDPRRMSLAGDDAQGLDDLHRSIAGDGPQSLFGKAFYSLFGPLLQGERGRLLTENADDFSGVVRQSLGSAVAATNEWAAERERDMAAEAGSGSLPAQIEASEGDRVAAAARRARAGAAADAIVGQYPDNSVGYHVMGAGRSVPLMAAAVATRNPLIGAELIGAGTAAEQRSQALADGATTDQATASGVAHGVLEGSLDMITLGIARWGVGPVREMLVRRYGDSIASRLLARASASAPGRVGLAVAEGAATEIPTTVGQMASDELILGKDYTTEDYARGVRDSAIQGGGMSGTVYAATAPLRHIAQRVEDDALGQVIGSADDAATLRAQTEAAAGVRLGELSPADMEAFVRQAGGEGNVYLEAEQARVLFQANPEVLEALAGGPEALTEQLTTGDVVVPLARWLTVVPRLQNRDEILRHARRQAEALSEAEMQDFDIEALAAQFGVDTGDAAARANPDGAADPSQQVFDDVFGQLSSLDRYTPAAAEAQARLWQAVFSRFGDMTGQDPANLYQQYMAGIGNGRSSSTPDPRATRPWQGTARLDALIDSVRTPVDPAARELFGPSLSSWLVQQGGVQDEGGELRTFDAQRARPGLVNRRGLALDRARELAAEAGFLGADTTVADFLDALDRDLREGDVRSEALGNQERQTFELERQQLLDAISQNDRLRDMPTDEFAALTNQQIADELFGSASYNQSAAELDFGDRTDAQLDAEYEQMPETDGGRRLDTDLVRELSPEYRADRTRSPRIHKAASAFTKGRFARMLAAPVAEGRDNAVFFTAGGGGSGKSTATELVLGASNADIIYDGTLSNLPRARADVEATLASGRDARIVYVYRSPANSAAGAIGRAIRGRRPVPVSVLAEAHANAPKVVKALAEEYAGDARVQIIAINNDGAMQDADRMPISSIPEVSQDEAERVFRTALDEAATAGELDDALYTAFDGRAPDAGLGEAGSGRDEVRGSGQPTGNAVTDQTPPTGGVSASGPRTLFQRAIDGVRNLFQQPNPDGPRGQITIFPDRRMAISLFEKADRSTFLHESGHFFLEVYRDLATAENAPPALREDFATLLEWLGAESGTDLQTEQHEQFARGFESYLGEGKAPSESLQTVFSQFKAWLLSIYRSLRNLNVELTDDVRGVFDRMLASEEEIDASLARQNMQPLVRDIAEAEAIGLTEAQFRKYQEQVARATDEAKADVLASLMKAWERERAAWWREEEVNVRAEIEAEFDAQPVYRAARILAGGKSLASDPTVPEALRGLKLDREALVAVYGEPYLERLRRLYARQGGVDQDTAAAMLGFSSGDALVVALANRADLKARVDAEVQDRMRSRHGDPMVDGTLPEMAMDAVHGNYRVRLLEYESALLEALAADPLAVPDLQRPAPPQQAGGPRQPPTPQAVANRRAAQARRSLDSRRLRALAVSMVAKKTPRELRPTEYLAAERRAARQATVAASRRDFPEALLAKRQQALNVALYAEARRAQEAFESNERYLRRAASDKTRERIGKQAGKFYVDALDAIFAGIEVRGVSGREVARRAGLRDWVRKMQEAGNNTAVPESLLERVESERVTNISDMPIPQVQALREAVENLLHLARVKNRLLTTKGERDWDDAKAELVERLEQQAPAHGRGGISSSDRAGMDAVRDYYAAGANWVLQPETLVEWLDGGTSGPFHDLLWEQSEAAEHTRERLNRMVGEKLQAALHALPATERKALDRRYRIDSMDADLSGHSILSALLNMGNAGNRDKLLRGGRVVGDEIVPFTEAQLAEMFSKLSRPHAELVQRVWDAIDQLWPEIVKLEEALNGIAPERIQAQPFAPMTKDGQVPLRGGYYPAMYDSAGAKVGQFAEDDQAKRVLAGQTPIRATTSKGHTEARTEYVAPLLLDYHSVLTRHLDGVIGDIAYRQFLQQAFKVLGDADIRRMIDNRVGPGAAKGLQKAFERGATGNFSLAGPLFGPFQKAADATMTNLSSAALGFRVPLALANVVTAPILASARVKKRFLVQGFADYYGGGPNVIANMRNNAKAIHALSPMMLKRSEARSVELASIIANLRGTKGVRSKMIELAMSVHQWIVPLAENAIWLSAYKQAQAGGADITESVRQADKAIRQTQTKHTAKDLASAEGGYMRPLMMFAGPLVIINNRLQEAGLRGLRGDVRNWQQALGVWIAMAAGGSWVFELMMGRGADDEDDDGEVGFDDWMQWAATKAALMPFSAFPVIREWASYAEQGWMRGSPLAEAGKSVVDAATSLGGVGKTALDGVLESVGIDIFQDEEIDKAKVLESAVRATGTVTGIPSNQLLRSGEYLMAVGAGEHTPENPAAEAYYLVQGPPEED